MNSPTVVVAGNALIDHTYRLTNMPAPDEGAFVRRYERHLGGVSTNVGTIVSKLGHDTGLIARVGDDDDGDAVVELLADSPLRTRIQRRKDDETSYCLVLTGPDGARIIIGGGDSTLRLSLNETDRRWVDDAEATFTSSYAPARVARTLARSDPPLVYDLSADFTDLRERGINRDAVESLLPNVACFVTTHSAATSFLRTDRSPEGCIEELLARGATRGAITCGAAGAYLFDGSTVMEVPSLAVDVRDTTGAGDAFTAGLIHAWILNDDDVRDAGRFAAATAALNCSVEGAHTNAPTVDEVEARLE